MAGGWDRERLTQVIHQWNVDHYDLFELSAPNQDLEFHGVVRFYFQGGNGASVITKCLRVSSTAATSNVIDTLIEKFRPDMRMLTQNKYALYEVHVNGEERRLGDDEKVLWVQLNWGKDVREGRFLLKDENEKTLRDPALGFREPAREDPNPPGNFKRKLSKREKKERRRREEEERARQNQSVSSKLYTEAPETSFTRSISNPEAVMRRRRQQKLEKKLAQMQSRSDSGGTLKIYGESLQPDVPYKTLLLSTADTTATVIREAMEKYGLEKEDPAQFCLLEVMLPPGSQEYHGGSVGEERVLDDGECPLAISLQHPKHRGTVIFQLRHRSADFKRRNKRQRAVSHDDLRKAHDQPATQADRLPYLIDLNARDSHAQRHLLPLNITEVGREEPVTPTNQFLQLSAPDIRPQHCILAHTEGIVTVTPTVRDAEIFVENRRVTETTMLRHGMTLQFGRHHFFRFLDPRFEEVSKQPQGTKGAPPPSSSRNVLHQETSFDVDGHIETVTKPPGTSGRVTPGAHTAGRTPPHKADQLPAALDFRLEAEDRLLKAVVQEANSRSVQFKLAPTYVLYLAVRRLLVLPAHTPSMPRPQHAQLVSDFVAKMSKLIQRTIQEQHNDPTSLAFWMANTSEVLHLVKQDVGVRPFAAPAQELLAEAVQMAFHHLVRCFQGDLQRVMPAFLDPSEAFEDENPPQDPYSQGQPMLADVLNTLSAAMTLLRRCRVNAALTIQLFSQLFHFINMWLFNILLMEPQLQLCSRLWGLRLKRRLGRVEAWAERQGLELAADCHLCRIIQAAHLLQAPKVTNDDINSISSTCFKLNSLQVRALLTRYIPDANEPPVCPAFVERVVAIAEDMTDELTRSEGGEVRLEEDPDLHLPFLLPEDGYSCDTLRGIPDGLPEFVSPLTSAGLCHMTANASASGSWTVYMDGQQSALDAPPSPQSGQPEVIVVSFKKLMGSMGLSIVAAVGEGLSEKGIYIKSVVPGGAAAQDGRLKAGDQLVEVDGKSLVGLTQDKAAELMTQTGSVVTLKVAKEGAVHHGLATLLDEPSPTMQRHATKVSGMGTPEEAPPPYTDQRQGLGSDGGRSRPVPQPRGMTQGPRGDLDRGRSPSADSLSSSGQQQRPHPRHPPPANFQRRDVDPRSKSTSNLHAGDRSFEQDDGEVGVGGMRGATSVGVLHHPAGGQQYPPLPYQQGGNTHAQPSPHAAAQELREPDSGALTWGRRGTASGHYNINENFNPGGVGPNYPAAHRPSDRSSLSSRSSSNSGRDPRPQSAYYDAHPPQQQLPEDPSGYANRPKSVEVTTSKVKEWQEKYTPQNMNVPGSQRSPHHSDPGRPGMDPRSRQSGQQSAGYRAEEGGAYGYRTEKNPGYSAENSNSSAPPPPTHKGPLIPKSGASAARDPTSSSRQPQASRGGSASTSAHHSNFRAAVQSRPQEAPRLSARERLFGKQGGPPPVGSGGGGVSRVPPKGEQQSQPPHTLDSSQPPPQTSPVKPEAKPKPAVKPKPPVARKPQLSIEEVAPRAADGQQVSSGDYGNQGAPAPQESRFGHQGHHFPPHGNQAAYGHHPHPHEAVDDFPPPPEDELLNLPPPPPMEEFYDPRHDEEGERMMMDPIPPPPNLPPPAYDEYGQPLHSSGGRSSDPTYQNFGPAANTNRSGGVGPPQHNNAPLPPHSSSSTSQPWTQRGGGLGPENPAWSRGGGGGGGGMHRVERQQSYEARAREQEIASLQSRSYLSLGEQDRLRQLLQEQEFHRRLGEERGGGGGGDYDADDSEVESYGRSQQYEAHPGRRGEGPPRGDSSSSRQNHMYAPPQQQGGPPYAHPAPYNPDPVSEERQRLEALSMGPRPPFGSSGRNNPLGSAFQQPSRDNGDQGYEYMNFPPPHHHHHQQGTQPQPPQRSSSMEGHGVSAPDQGYHSMPHPHHPHHPQHYTEGLPSPDDYQSFPGSKKTVSFNTDLNTYQIRTPSHSFSSEHMSPPADISPSAGTNEVFQMPPSSSSQHPYHPPAPTSYGTPNVIGAQEVYRDPRSRIEAQKAAEQSSRSEATENMSFRDKMKYFGKEGVEGGSQPAQARPPWNSDYQSNGR
ncbi:afadin-like [Babylonia areolata]|uniref:afadin-like n=1 Tax=Babylonia areolata TaxID=304850 RepID=UPI003FD24EED